MTCSCGWLAYKVDIAVLVWDFTHSIWSSGLLDADDMHFLESLNPQHFESPPQSKAVEQEHVHEVVINALAVFGLISALLSQLFLVSINVFSTMIVAVSVVLLVSGLAMTFLLLLKYYCLVFYWQWQQFARDVRDLMANVKSCYDVYLKCVRLIEEQELITTGYSRKTADICTDDLRGCFALRVTMEKLGMPVFFGMREATCQLIQKVPISCFVDDSSHYIALVELKNLPVCELAAAPQTLSQLKCLLRLVKSQTSEYFRRLILCFTKRNLHSLWELNRTTKLLKPALTNLLLLCNQWNSSLQEAFKLQRKLLTENNHLPVITKMQQAHKNNDLGVSALLQTASKTEVCLQSALLRVRELAQCVDTIGHTSQLGAVEAMGEWLELDMSSCVSSCRYLLSNLQPLLHPEADVLNKSRLVCSSVFDCQEKETTITASKAMENGEQTGDDDDEDDGDEKVYEAYVPPGEHMQEDGPSQYQQEACHDMEDPVKMITELKTVLAAKATAKAKSELSTQQSIENPGNHVTGHTCNTVSNKSRSSREFVGDDDDTAPPIDMSSLHAALVKARPRETVVTDELEASGEADSIMT